MLSNYVKNIRKCIYGVVDWHWQQSMHACKHEKPHDVDRKQSVKLSSLLSLYIVVY